MIYIEDGTGQANAQSYATVAELVAYAAARSVALPPTELEQEGLLLEAAAFLEMLAVDPGFIGRRNSRTQALAWPRTGASVESFVIPATEIPREIKMAQMQLALDALVVELLPTRSAPDRGTILEESIEGAVSVKYDKLAPTLGLGMELVPGAQLGRAAAFVKPFLRWDAPVLQVPVARA